jgi:hypothetical protein
MDNSQNEIVKISYSVKVDQVPDVLAKLLYEKIVLPFKSFIDFLKSCDKDTEYPVTKIEDIKLLLARFEVIRTKMFDIDLAFSDLSELYSSYLDYLSQGKKKEIEEELVKIQEQTQQEKPMATPIPSHGSPRG